MTSDRRAEVSGLGALLGVGAAALGLAWWFGRPHSRMSEDQALRVIKTADVTTPEGRRKLEAASVVLGIERRRRAGEIIDNSTIALERAKAAANFDFGSKGTHFFEALEDFEKQVTRLPAPDTADLRKDRTSR